LPEFRPALGEGVEVGRGNIGAAIEADIFPAEIIRDDVNDVRTDGIGASGDRKKGRHEGEDTESK
jgi:hypothetical protein